MKGVLSINHAEQKFVYQAVHMIFNGNFEEEWAQDEKRESKLVFIGKNLDHAALKEGFAACIVTPEVLEKKKKTLRFAMGDTVECMPPGMVAPYQVKLASNGSLIYAPADSNDLV